MKKRILLISLMLILFTLALAASVSASTIYRDENGLDLLQCETANGYEINSYEIKNGGFAKTDASGKALTWYLVSTTQEGDNTIKTVKSALTESVYVNGSYTNGVSKNSVVSANFDEGMTSIIAFGSYGSDASKEILFVYVPSTVTSLPDRFMQNGSALVCEIPENSQITTMGYVAFYSAKNIRSIYFPASLKTILYKNGHEFAQDAKRLESVVFAENCQITEIPHGTFYGCSSLKRVTFPNSVTTACSRVFQNCYGLEYINLGASFAYMKKTDGNHSFAFCATNLKTVVIPATFDASNLGDNIDYCFQPTWGATSNVTFYYTGTEAEFKLLQEKFAKAGNNSEIVGATLENGRLVLVNHCETYYNGVHAYDEADCTKTCTRCGIVVKQENPKHNLTNVITYANGYLLNGNKHEKCTNEGCGYEADVVANPLISFGGIASNKNTDMCVKYNVDTEAVSEYRLAGNIFKFGVVACAPNENSLEVIDASITKVSEYNTIAIEIDDDHTAFDFVMRDFTNEHYDRAIVMSAFVSDGTSVDYINTSLVSGVGITVSQDAQANTITLKSVAEYVPPVKE